MLNFKDKTSVKPLEGVKVGLKYCMYHVCRDKYNYEYTQTVKLYDKQKVYVFLWSSWTKSEQYCENMSSRTLVGFIKNEDVEVGGRSRNPQLLERSGICVIEFSFCLGLPPSTHLCLSCRIQPLHLLARSDFSPCIVYVQGQFLSINSFILN